MLCMELIWLVGEGEMPKVRDVDTSKENSTQPCLNMPRQVGIQLRQENLYLGGVINSPNRKKKLTTSYITAITKF